MRRVRNWDLALHAWAATEVGRPYVWGETDCVALAVRALAVLYPAPPRTPAFPTKGAALRAVADHPDLIADTLRAMGATAWALPFATTGDLLAEPGTPPALLVGLGAMALTTGPADGVQWVPVTALAPGTLAWRCPDG